METSYQGGVAEDETDDFQRLSQTIASNVKKISQNGKLYYFNDYSFVGVHIIIETRVSDDALCM